MGYKKVEESKASGGCMAPAPESGGIKNMVFEDEGEEFCLIEWKSDTHERWFLAEDEAFVSLDNSL